MTEPTTPAPINDDAAEHLVKSYGAGSSDSAAGASGGNMTTLTQALAHLRAFRQTFNPSDSVDEESHLTADDLTVIIETIEAIGNDVVARDPDERV